MIKLSLSIIILFLVLTSCSEKEKSIELIVINGNTMGTTFTVKYLADNAQESTRENLEDDLNKILIEINMQMSTYIEDSEISRFNKNLDTNWFPISHDFTLVILKALFISKQSNGAFDITIGPLVNLWGFGPEFKNIEIPKTQELKLAKSKTGYDKIEIDSSNSQIRKKIRGVYIDLSAIAKGFGVDKLCELLERRNITNYMIEIGGEVRASGNNQNDGYWKIGIQTPDENNNLQKVIPLNNYAIATSGDYQNYFEIDGKRYSHTIDARTGFPITHKLASVSVLHESCTMADGYATAINVLGPEDGYRFALNLNLPAYMIVREANGYVEKTTSQFDNLIDKK